MPAPPRSPDHYRESLLTEAVNAPLSASPLLMSPAASQYENDPGHGHGHGHHHRRSRYVDDDDDVRSDDDTLSLSNIESEDDGDAPGGDDDGHYTGRVLCMRHELYNILILSFGLMFLFASFNTLQSWVTNLLLTLGYSNLGNWSLGTLYVSVCVSLVVTPPLVSYLGHIKSILLGSFCYLVYIASLIRIVPAVVLIASAINGFGASLLWVAIGGFLTRCSSHSDRGLMTGIFWSIFQLSGIVGNISAFFIFNSDSSNNGDRLFIIFTALAAFGTLMLCALKPFPEGSDNDRDENGNESADVSAAMNPQGENEPLDPEIIPTKSRPTVLSQLKALWSVSTSATLMLVVPAFFFQGIEFSYWNGEWPLLFDASLLGIVMVFAGVGEAFGGLSMGWISDKIGRSLTWLIGCVLYCMALACNYAIKQNVDWAVRTTVTIHTLHDEPFELPVIAFVASFCFGLADSAICTQIYAMLGDKYKKKGTSATKSDDEERVTAAFTFFNFNQNIGAAVGFVYQPFVPVHGDTGTNIQLYVNLWLLIVACAGFVACDRGWMQSTTTCQHSEPVKIKRARGEWAEPMILQVGDSSEGSITPARPMRTKPKRVL